MKILAAGTLFLPVAFASNAIFGYVTDPACGPCLDEVIANGPGSTQSKEFAAYLCMGSGGSAVAVCITECGSKSPSDDPIDIAASNGQVQVIMGSVFDYCVRYYPAETCAAFEGVFGREPLAEVCSGAGTVGGNEKNSLPGSDDTTTSARGIAAGSSTATIGTTPTGTAATGTQRTQSPSSAAAALAPWEMLIGLVMLAVNI